MRRFRLSTLMLLIVTASLSLAVVVQQRRAARREAELEAQIQFDQKKYNNMKLLFENEQIITKMQSIHLRRLETALSQGRSGGERLEVKERTER
jgi:uncharacterized protein HemX